MNNRTNNLIIFLVGALAGIGFGILYAPEKGSNTRNKLTFQLYKYKARLTEIIEKLEAEKELPLSAAQAEGQKVVNDAKDKAEKLLEDVEELIGQIKIKTRK